MPHLPNYLRSFRKRLALSQDEIAFLLGTFGGAKVSRYEQFTRLPNLKTALALEVIHQRPVSELFAGLHKKIRKEVQGRAQTLLYKTSDGNPKHVMARKRQALMIIIKISLNHS